MPRDTSAFPSAYIDGDDDLPSQEPGMTYRQWLAGQAMAGLCANPAFTELIPPAAVSMADRVIAELEITHGK